MIEDADRCYLAVQSRDPRFDGRFFTAVTSTGIYCRPSCPARTPMRSNVRFYPSAAAAQAAGFRACKRCRPGATPGSPEWDTRADVVARAMRLIGDGLVDRVGVPGLAARLGYSVRHLERLLSSELGAGPIALARAQRAQTARVLIESTTLPLAQVAFAAGFASVRQFNDTIRSVFAASPTDLRARVGRSGAGPVTRPPGDGPAALVLRLPFRRPFSPDTLFGQLAATAVPGVEEVRGTTYRRTLDLAHGPGIVELTPGPDSIRCRAVLSNLRDLTAAISRCRRLLDLDADPVAVDHHLGSDPLLRPLIAAAPGRRVARCVDGAELAVRAVLGQHVPPTVARARAGHLVRRYGQQVVDTGGGLTHLFPSPEALRTTGPGGAASPRALTALVGALCRHELDLTPGGDRTDALSVLAGLPGVGARTVDIIAMRALGDPDALPLTDPGIRRGAEVLGLPPTSAGLARHSRAWRPWRSYAATHLWSVVDHPADPSVVDHPADPSVVDSPRTVPPSRSEREP